MGPREGVGRPLSGIAGWHGRREGVAERTGRACARLTRACQVADPVKRLVNRHARSNVQASCLGVTSVRIGVRRVRGEPAHSASPRGLQSVAVTLHGSGSIRGAAGVFDEPGGIAREPGSAGL